MRGPSKRPARRTAGFNTCGRFIAQSDHLTLVEAIHHDEQLIEFGGRGWTPALHYW
jgi:hypothetical protein